jgi:uncharacterized membrane protein YgdD (TMEM256/DUF423 family)
MPSSPLQDQRRRQLMAAVGALYAAAAVALSAYAAHAVQGTAQTRLETAAILAFGHGIALAALAPATASHLGHIALLALCIGVLLFSGSLAFSVFAQWPTTLAPLGGMLLIGGWLAFAIDLLRR